MTRINRVLLLCFVFSIGALLIALLAEYAWGIKSCTLCRLQRIPLFLAVPISILGVCQAYKWPYIVALHFLFFALLILAGYHLLVQIGFLSDPCSVPQIKTLNEFKTLMTEKHLSCKNSWTIFGVPASAYNMILALFFMCILPKTTKEGKSY